TPCRRKASSAPASRASTTTALKRAATTAKRPDGVEKSPSITVAMRFGSPHPVLAEDHQQHAEREADHRSEGDVASIEDQAAVNRAQGGQHHRHGVHDLRFGRWWSGGLRPAEELRQVLGRIYPSALVAANEAVALGAV